MARTGLLARTSNLVLRLADGSEYPTWLNRLEQHISETPEQRGTLKEIHYYTLEASRPTVIHVGDGYKTPDGTEGDVELRHVERVSERKFHKRAPVVRAKVSAEVRCTDLGRTLHCIPDSPVVCISVDDR